MGSCDSGSFAVSADTEELNLISLHPHLALIAATMETSNLLVPEAAFALGQMQDNEAIPALESVLNDFSLHPIVHHEAAEALCAIGLETNNSLKKNLVTDPAQEVRETCELALSQIEELKDTNHCDRPSATESSSFLSADHAVPASCSSVDQLRFDEGSSIVLGYMFRGGLLTSRL